jgi:hypothetical protein
MLKGQGLSHDGCPSPREGHFSLPLRCECLPKSTDPLTRHQVIDFRTKGFTAAGAAKLRSIRWVVWGVPDTVDVEEWRSIRVKLEWSCYRNGTVLLKLVPTHRRF